MKSKADILIIECGALAYEFNGEDQLNRAIK